MALRARELFYFVRIGNYATGPLRQIEGEFKRLGAISDTTTKKLAALDLRERRAFEKRANLMRRRTAMMPGGRQFIDLQERQARKMATLENARTTALTRQQAAKNKLHALDRVGLDLNNQRLAQERAQILNERRISRLQRKGRAVPPELMLRRQEITGRLKSVRARTGERIGSVIAVEKALRRQEAELIRLQATESEYAAKFGRDQAKMSAEAQALTGKIRTQHKVIRGLRAERTGIQEAQAAQQLEREAARTAAFSGMLRGVQFASAGIVVALGYAAHAAANFQKDAAQAATQVGGSFGQMQTATTRIMDGVTKQMNRFPASAKEMTDASYDIFSSLTLAGNQSQQTAQGLNILAVANKAAVAGSTSLEESTSGIVVLLNTFGRATKNSAVDVSQLDGFLNKAFATVRFGRLTFGQFTQALATTAPAAKSANQSLGSMSGTLAFLTRRMPVRQAAVSYARLLEVIQRSAAGLKKTKVDVRDASGQMRPLEKIIGDIVAKNPNLVKGKKFVTEYFKAITKGAGAGTIGTIQARRGFVFLVQQFSQYQKILRQVNNTQDQFAKSYDIMRRTAGVRWDIFLNRLKALALEVGVTVIPIFEKLTRPIQRAVKWFNNLGAETKNTIATFVAWGAAFALIASTLGLGIIAITSFMTAIGGIETAGVALAFQRWSIPLLAILILLKKYPHAIEEIINKLTKMQGLPIVIFLTLFSGRLLRLAAGMRAVSGAAPEAAGSMGIFRGALLGLAATAATVLARLMKIGKFFSAIPDTAKQFGETRIMQPGGIVVPAIGMGGGKVGDVKKLGGVPYRLTKEGVWVPVGTPFAPRGREQPFVERARGAGIATWELHAPARAAAAAARVVSRNKSMQKYVTLLVAANKAVAKHPHSIEAQLKLYRLRDKISAKFTSNEASAIEAVASSYEDADKKKVKSAKKAAEEMKKVNADAIQTMAAKYKELLDANQAALGSITEGVRVQDVIDFGGIPRFSDLMGDMTDKVKNFIKWRDLLARGRQILPRKLMDELQAAGVTGAPIIQGILQLPPRQRAQLIAMWKKGQEAVKKATAVDFQNQLTEWRSHGAKSAKAFVQGMKDEQPWITKQMRAIWTDWLKKQGWNRPTTTTPRDGHRRPRQPRQPTASHTTHHHNDNRITVNHGHEDLSTTLRKARAAQRARARGGYGHRTR